MPKIEFPKQLKELLEGSELEASIRSFADRAGEILADNKLPFFPDYTDHGIDHINRTLKTEVELVPKNIWDGSKRDSDPRLLCKVDAAILIGATLLHDIAMHLRPNGFLELVDKDSRFQPLSWFNKSHEGHSEDLTWFELWQNYIREARRFSERQLSNIIGEKSASVWKFEMLPGDTGQWELNHRLIIGEFIRRHHARLAHEIAMYGFPGLPEGWRENEFPAIGKENGTNLKRIANLMGLTARSHGMSLRVCKDYLDYQYVNSLRQDGSVVLYPMALLRVADYLQIDQTRAPAVLLQLRDPQSQVSVQEWKKHRAVERIEKSKDPRGIMVSISNDICLPVYLQIQELLKGLQTEIDHSTAVLDETYGTFTEQGLHQLNLAIRRIHSNLESPAFLENLQYVAKKTGFSTDPNLLTLLVEPLYGSYPGVGVRELLQNAVDAVCELEVWCKNHTVSVDSLDLPELGCDVLIEFEQRDNGSWVLRVQDRGIGMTSETIQNYFLRAGASFRQSTEWSKEFLDDEGKPQVVRAGRFGIGAFAVFLLGSSFKLWTRHVSADKSVGYSIEVTATSQLVEIHRENGLQIGTLIEVELGKGTVQNLDLEDKNRLKYKKYKDRDIPYKDLNHQIDWFCWDWPKVNKLVKRNNELISLEQMYKCPVRKSKLPLEWSVIYPAGFDAVFWTFDSVPTLSCNGLMIYSPIYDEDVWRDDWSYYINLNHPDIAVIDSASNLPLTIQRYEQSHETLPFRVELERDVLLSFIANTLVCGPLTQMEALLKLDHFPLTNPLFLYNSDPFENRYSDKGTPFRWYASPEGMVLRDEWLFTLLNTKSCCMYGIFGENNDVFFRTNFLQTLASSFLEDLNCPGNQVIFSWFGNSYYDKDIDGKMVNLLFSGMAEDGIINENMISASHFLISIRPDIGFSFNKTGSTKNDDLWSLISRNNSERLCFETKTNSFNSQLPLQKLLETLEGCIIPAGTDTPESIPVLFVADLKMRTVEEPESTLAEIWNECLGPNFIPFVPVARAALIEHGKKHPELKRHIEKWQEMKRIGSKWATGEWRFNR